MKIKKHWMFSAVSVGFLLIALALSHHISGRLYHMQTTQRWKGDSGQRFAHYACYTPVSNGKNKSEIDTLRHTLEQRLSENGLTASEQGRLYADAYSAAGTVSAVGEHGSAVLSAVGVGGDFFVFHPMELMSGGYISEQDLMQDRVVLDEIAAWQLFGGSDVAGLFIKIGEERYYVAGVVKREEDYASKKTADDRPVIYLSYDALAKMSDAQVTSYEVVMPEPVQNFGRELLKERFAADDSCELVCQSDRYSFSSLWKTFWSIGERMMGGSGIVYPRWEQAIRLTEFHLSLLLVTMLLLLIYPVITLLVVMIKLISRGIRISKKRIPALLEQKVEARKEKNYIRKEGEQKWLESH